MMADASKLVPLDLRTVIAEPAQPRRAERKGKTRNEPRQRGGGVYDRRRPGKKSAEEEPEPPPKVDRYA